MPVNFILNTHKKPRLLSGLYSNTLYIFVPWSFSPCLFSTKIIFCHDKTNSFLSCIVVICHDKRPSSFIGFIYLRGYFFKCRNSDRCTNASKYDIRPDPELLYCIIFDIR